ncbi:PH domain-containing protein [uncultured Maribacter sp.]|uniref:PH domain-containing protein n=1 Tax=uncultured Maribacter sp. TaxID=431308 RepID=UPI0030EECF67|tara:strand:- start:32400 stop:32828 length:429 start_codon:yes stop_codon:yes gene_type:complete
MKTYKSKFGFEIMLLMIFIFGGILGFMVYRNEPLQAILSVGGIFLLVYGLCLYLNFSTEYTITEAGVLKVKCGFFYNKQFDINKIRSVAKTGNLISSPAPSLDRIELTYGKFDLIIISPKDKFEFARELTKVNPRIENKLNE